MAAVAVKSTSVPVLQRTVANQQATIKELRTDKRQADERAKAAVADATKKQNALRRALGNSNVWAVLGAVGGGALVWYFAYDYLASYFEANSYIPGLIFVLAGVGFSYGVPRLVKDGSNPDAGKAASNALMRSGLRGFGIGAALFGAYKAYEAYQASQPATP